MEARAVMDRQLTLTGQLAGFVARARYEELPPEVVHAAKRALLDLLGCALSGSTSPDVSPLVRGIHAYDHGEEATLWGTNRRASVPMAAMGNGASAHVRELDDWGGPGHPGTVAVPAALALGEARKMSGREVLAGIALGYEVMFRIVDGVGSYDAIGAPGWHPISVIGGFGGAAAAGKLLGLDPKRLTWALGLAGSFAGGSWAFLRDGSMSKRWHPGRAAANGLEAAFLAREGFTGPTEILEAPWGSFYGAHFPAARLRPDLVTAGLGTDYRMLKMGFKVHACCLSIHAYLDTFLRLRARHDFAAEEIAAIEVGGNELTLRMLGKREVRTVLDAQMSLGYVLAAAAHTGQVGLEEFAPRWLEESAVHELAARVAITVDPSNTGWSGRRVQVRLKSGEVLSDRTEELRGSPARPLSDSDLASKFDGLAIPVVGPSRARRIAEAVWGFDRVEDVSEFCRLLVL